MNSLINSVMFRTITLIILTQFLVYCSSTKEPETENSKAKDLETYLIDLKVNNDLSKDVYLIIPENICGPCLDKYKDFIVKNKSSKIGFILSGHFRKTLLLTFGSQILEKSNVIIDDKGLLYETPLFRDVGQIVYLKEDNQLDKIVEISADKVSDELLKLNEFLNGILESKISDERLLSILNSPSTYFKHFIGKKAPLINAKTLDAEEYNLEDYIGRVVVINFWYIGCPSCVKEIPDLNKLYTDSKKENYEFISIASNSKEELDAFFESRSYLGLEHKINFKVIPGEKSIASAFNVTLYPVTLVINKKGDIAYCVTFTRFQSAPDELATYLLVKKAIEIELSDQG